MKIRLSAVLVADQEHALNFYTRVLGFRRKADLAAGDYRWLTVVSAQEPEGAELLLEPIAFAPAATYQRALFEAGIAITSFAVDDIHAEAVRLRELGVVFRMPPTDTGSAIVAQIEDTCGNLIQLVQVRRAPAGGQP